MKNGPYFDLGYSSLKVLQGDKGLEVPIERRGDGRLTDESRRRVRERLRGFLEPTSGKREAACAVSALGVSLRRFDLPPTTEGNVRRLLALKLEAEFPLPPADLAWGYQIEQSSNGLPSNGLAKSAPRNGAEPRRAAVLALRREALEDYAGLMDECGIAPTFVLGAVAASRRVPTGGSRFALLDIGRAQSDLIEFVDGMPSRVRSIAWGGATIDDRIGGLLGLDAGEAEARKIAWQGSTSDVADASRDGGAVYTEGAAMREAIEHCLALLADQIEASWRRHSGDGRESDNGAGPAHPETLYLCGGGARLHGLADELGRLLGVPCRSLEPVTGGEGCSDVNVGLQLLLEGEPTTPALSFLAPDAATRLTEVAAPPKIRHWLAGAAALLVLFLVLRYAVPLSQVPGLRADIDAMRGRLAEVPGVERELGFLDAVAASQMRELEALAALASSAPKGMLITEISLSRSGAVTISGTARKSGDVMALRRQMNRSGWYRNDVLQDLSVKKKIQHFRLSAQLVVPADFVDPDPADEVMDDTPSPTGPAAPHPGAAPTNVAPTPPPGNVAPLNMSPSQTTNVTPTPGAAATTNAQPTTQPTLRTLELPVQGQTITIDADMLKGDLEAILKDLPANVDIDVGNPPPPQPPDGTP